MSLSSLGQCARHSMIARKGCHPGRALMPRCQQLDESQLDAAQRRVFNDCKAGPRGSVPPPVHVWLRSPGLADHAHQLGAHVRFGTPFTPKQTEIAILMAARYWAAQVQTAAHGCPG